MIKEGNVVRRFMLLCFCLMLMSRPVCGRTADAVELKEEKVALSSTASSTASDDSGLSSDVTYGPGAALADGSDVGYMGAFAYSIPLSGAPGRMGGGSALSFGGGGPGDLAGYGWKIPVSAITRSGRYGVNQIYSTNEFFANGAELMAVENTEPCNYFGSHRNEYQEYRPRFEGSFTRYFFHTADKRWVVLNRNGSKQFYGSTAAVRMTDPQNAAHIYAWYLEKAEDIHGNKAEYVYHTDQRRVYPSQIRYNGFSNEVCTMDIRFEPFYTLAQGGSATERPDVTESYAAGYNVKTRYRLERVEAYAGSELVTKYTLNYTTGENGLRSLLASVTRVGSDGDSTLPSVSFEYSTPDIYGATDTLTGYALPDGLRLVDELAIGTPGLPVSTGVRFGDVNGDGLQDLIYACHISGGYDHYPVTGTRIWLNTGNGWSAPAVNNTPSTDCAWTFPSCVTNVRGTAHELLSFAQNMDNNHGQLYTSADPTGVVLSDLNGDGYVDILASQTFLEAGTEASSAYHVISLSTAWINNRENGWVRDDSWALPTTHPMMATYCNLPMGDFVKATGTGAQLVDLNGDGLPDYVYGIKLSGIKAEECLTEGHVSTSKKVLLNTGSGWLDADTDWQLPDGYYLSDKLVEMGGLMSVDGSLRFADLNGDGLSDLIYANGTLSAYSGGGAARTRKIWLNNGMGWTERPDWALPDVYFIDDVASRSFNREWSRSDDTGVRFVDMNSDGLTDIIRSRYYFINSDPAAYINNPPPESTSDVWLNTGSSWTHKPHAYTGEPIVSYAYYTWNNAIYQHYVIENGVRPIDLNSDGSVDWLCSRAVATGSGEDVSLPVNTAVCYPQFRHGNDILQTIRNGLGGRMAVEYSPAVQTPDWQCPSAMGVVSAVKTSDGLGNTYTTRYDYAGGWFHWDASNPFRRGFRGFHCKTSISTIGSSNVVYYHQGNGNDAQTGESGDCEAVAGRPYCAEVYGNNNELYARSLTQWGTYAFYDVLNSSDYRRFAFSEQEVAMAYEGQNAPLGITGSRTYYDKPQGLVTGSASLGWVAADALTGEITDILEGDELYTSIEYADMENDLLIGLPARTLISAEAGVKLGETLIKYNAAGQVTNTLSWLDEDNTYLSSGEVLAFDKYGHVTRSRDAAGIESELTYDPVYHLYVVQENTGGFVSTAEYDPRSGQMLKAVDPLGLVASNAYDVFFRPDESWVDGIWQQRVEYTLGGCADERPGNSTHVIANPGSTIGGTVDSYAYADGLGRTVQTRAESERSEAIYRVSNRVFDEAGRVTCEYEPSFGEGAGWQPFYAYSPAVTYTYDPLGRVVTVTPRTGDDESPTAPTHTAYTDAGQLAVVSTDALGHQHKVFSDAYGRTTNVTDVVADSVLVSTTYRYDKLGRLLDTVDPEGNTISLQYDSLGRKIRMDDPDMGVWNYAYDSVGRMTNQTDASGNRVTFAFDALSRMSRKCTYDASGTLVNTVTWHYDASDDPAFTVRTGQLYKVVQNGASNRFSYTSHGLISKAELGIDGVGTFVSSNTYDEMDRLLTATYPNNVAALDYQYGRIGNLVSVSSAYGLETNLTFYQVGTINELGQVEKVTYGNGIESRFAYYTRSRRARQTMTRRINGPALQNLNYRYNSGGLITDITDNLRTGEAGASYQNIQYDDLYRLTALDRCIDTQDGMKTFQYHYDLLGNILSNADYAAGGAYQYTSSRPHALTAIGSDTYQYDACGNITNAAGKALAYDARNRLTHVLATDGSLTTFDYLDSGARFRKTVISADGNTTNTTLYIGQSMEIQNGEPLCHVFFGGKRVASFTPVTQSQQTALIPRWNTTREMYPGGPVISYVARPMLNVPRLYKILKIASLIALLLLLLYIIHQPCKTTETRRHRGRWISEPLCLCGSHPITTLFRGLSGISWFRKGTAWLLIITLTAISFPEAAEAQNVYPRGDVNGDELVNLADAMLIRQVLQGVRTMSNIAGFMNGDVNFDGATNATDAKMIAQYVAGLRDLPTPPAHTQKLLFYHSDHLGGSNIITDGSGNLIQHVQYSPYGEIDYELNLGVSVNYLFTGQEFDREAGLYYYNARYYDPEIGRFIQPDTIIPDPSDNQAYNRYSYCRNNPIMLTDPSGHEPTPDDVRREQYWLINQHTAADRLGDNAAAQRLEIYDQFDHFMLPALAGMKDDDAVRVNMFYEWAMSGGAVSEGLQNEMTAQGVDSPDALWSYYVNDTVEDEAGDWTEYAGIGMAAVILGISSAGLGAASAIGLGMTTSTGLSFTGSVVAGGITGGISGGGMAYISGQNVMKGILAGAAIGATLSGVNYIVGQWSGCSKDTPTVLHPDGSSGAVLPNGGRIGTNGVYTTPEKAINNMNKNGYDAWLYNPTHGLAADLVESFQEILFGPGSWSRNAAPILDSAAKSGAVFSFVAHSQGGIQFGQALSLMNQKFAVGSAVHFVNTPYNALSAHINGVNAGLRTTYGANALDIVSAMGNPWLLPSAIVALPYYVATGAGPHVNGAW